MRSDRKKFAMNRFMLVTALIATLGSATGQTVQQSGTVTRNHVPVWVTSGVIGDGGSASSSPISSFGVTNNGGAGICVNSALPTAAGYNALCLGASTTSAATISLQNYGTAAAQSIQFNINGSLQGFPTVSPLPVVTGDLVCFSNTTGGLTDCGNLPSTNPLVFGSTKTTGYSNTQILSSNGSVLSAYSVSGSGNVALTTSPNVTAPQILPNGSNLFMGLQKPGTRTWNFSYSSLDMGSGSPIPALEIQSDLSGYPTFIGQNGRLMVNNLIAGFPNLSGGLNDSTGPGIAVGGDIIAGDIGSIRSAPHIVITGAVNDGSGHIKILISSDPTATLANSQTLQIGGIVGTGGLTANANGIWTISNYVANTSFVLVGSTFVGAYTSGGWFGTGADVQQIGRSYPGSIPSPGVVLAGAGFLDGTVGAGGAQTGTAQIVVMPDSTLPAIHDYSGVSSPGSIFLTTYSDIGGSPGYVEIGGRISANTVGTWERLSQGQINFSATLATAPVNGIGLSAANVMTLYAANAQQLNATASGVQINTTAGTPATYACLTSGSFLISNAGNCGGLNFISSSGAVFAQLGSSASASNSVLQLTQSSNTSSINLEFVNSSTAVSSFIRGTQALGFYTEGNASTQTATLAMTLAQGLGVGTATDPGPGAILANTSIRSPLVIGGSGTTGTQLTFQTTTGIGTTDAFAWKGGNNGGTTFATLSATAMELFGGTTPTPGQNNFGVYSGTTGPGIITVGQDGTHGLLFQWNFNATPASATAQLVTYGFTNPLAIDGSALSLQTNSGGNISVGTTATVMTLNGTTVSTTPTTGAETIAGGLGVAKAIYAGAEISAVGAFISKGSAPVGNTGSCTASSFVGGTTAGKFSAAVCAAGTIILSSLPTAPNGYTCDAQDQTTPADTLKQTANTVTSVTFTATTVASDTIVFKCRAW